jgi:hypothetical protein
VCLHEATVPVATTSRARTAVGAATATRGGSNIARVVDMVRATHGWATDDTGEATTDGRSKNLAKVLANMRQGNVLERDVANLTLAVVNRVPKLDVALLGLVKAVRGHRGSTLTGVVGGSLSHVARCATVIGAVTVAVLADTRDAMRRVQTNAASAVHRPLELGEVVRTREGLLSTRVAKPVEQVGIVVGQEQAWTAEGGLLHDRGVAELLDQSLTTLDGGVRDLSGLGRTVAKPATALDAVNESDHATDVGKVDEGIAHVAAGLEVDTEVHEVVGAEADLVEGGLERQL